MCNELAYTSLHSSASHSFPKSLLQKQSVEQNYVCQIHGEPKEHRGGKRRLKAYPRCPLTFNTHFFSLNIKAVFQKHMVNFVLKNQIKLLGNKVLP